MAGEFKFLTFVQSEDYSLALEVRKQDRTAADLTGKAATLRISAKANGQALLTKQATVGALQGTVLFVLSSTETASLPPGQLYFDIFMFDAATNNNRDALLYGTINVIAQAAGGTQA